MIRLASQDTLILNGELLPAMEIEKQQFLLDCIEESNHIASLYTDMDIARIKIYISTLALAGRSEVSINSASEILGCYLDDARLRIVMDFLIKNGLQVDQNPPGYIGFYRIRWS